MLPSPSAVSTLFGHASIVTTQKYVAHLALGELRAAIPALPVGNEPDHTDHQMGA